MGDGYRETRAIILQRFDTFIPKRIEDFQKSIVPSNFNSFHITRIQIPSFTAIQQRRNTVRLYNNTVQTFHSDYALGAFHLVADLAAR